MNFDIEYYTADITDEAKGELIPKVLEHMKRKLGVSNLEEGGYHGDPHCYQLILQQTLSTKPEHSSRSAILELLLTCDGYGMKLPDEMFDPHALSVVVHRPVVDTRTKILSIYPDLGLEHPLSMELTDDDVHVIDGGRKRLRQSSMR